jgi:exonuclease VII small subunit
MKYQILAELSEFMKTIDQLEDILRRLDKVEIKLDGG